MDPLREIHDLQKIKFQDRIEELFDLPNVDFRIQISIVRNDESAD